MPREKALLMILDGWGIGQNQSNNAIYTADTPYMDSLLEKFPHSTLTTYGEEVGLPEGQMGNSEVGHLNIGAGRIVLQELLKINRALASDDFLDQNISIQNIIEYCNLNGKDLHLMGLLSDGGVHSHIDHLLRLLDYLSPRITSTIYIHAFTDGRDTDPHSGIGFVSQLLEHIDNQKVVLASVIGRYYAMDRDKRWERVALAYNAIVQGEGKHTTDIIASIKECYEAGETDEFLKPLVLIDQSGTPLATLNEEEAMLCFNFRTDRCREIVEALSQKPYIEQGMNPIENLMMTTFTEYSKEFKNVGVVFDQEDVVNTLGEVVDRNGLWQIRIAETEKYPHVTFFFSGGREIAFEREDRLMQDSPRDVATYDLKPEMSAYNIKNATIPELERENASFICLNFANTDMVGHTGVFSAAVKAAETVDTCVSEIVPVALEHGYFIIIIADHGNSDYMINEDGSPNTAHTMNPVPFIFIHPEKEVVVNNGILADIAPTILSNMGLDIPEEMTGNILTQEN